MSIELSQPEIIDLSPVYISAVEKRKRWVDLGLVMLIAFSPSLLAATSNWLWPASDTIRWSGTRYAAGFLHEITGLLLLVYVLSRQNRSLSDIGLKIRLSDPLIAAGLMVAAIFWITVQTGMITLSTPFFLRHPADIRNPDMTTGVPVILLLGRAMMAGIFEETLVRGYLMTEMIALGKPVWLAAIASVVLQTSYHVYYGLAGALSISSIFIVFAIYFASSRRLFPVILAHSLWDVMAVLIKLHR